MSMATRDPKSGKPIYGHIVESLITGKRAMVVSTSCNGIEACSYWLKTGWQFEYSAFAPPKEAALFIWHARDQIMVDEEGNVFIWEL